MIRIKKIQACAPTGAFSTVSGTTPSYSWIFSPFLFLLTLYIAEHSWMQQARGGVQEVSTVFLGKESNAELKLSWQLEGMYALTR